jgi:phosphoserine phosphatase
MNASPRIVVSIDDQTLHLTGGGSDRRFRISTSAKGMGFAPGSHRTPTGRFRISEKIGGGMPADTIFKGRVPVGRWDPQHNPDSDLILSRILRLDGLDPENANTRERFVYIHGTNQENLLGSPAGHGCVRLSREDMIALFDAVEAGCDVEIQPATRRRGKLFFIDCDSTLSTIEGIDELARARGAGVFQQVAALTDAAMNGEVPLDEVFPRRMEMIRPDRAACDAVAALYVREMVPGAEETVAALKAAGWLPVIVSGGFAPLIAPLAARLGIDHVEAVPLHLDDDGCYLGYDRGYPTTRNLGKNEIIREWKRAMLPERVVMMGDGISDLETRPDVDLFIGFGGVAARDKVRAACDIWLESLGRGAVMDAMPSDW